jgi:hypothetical protein
VFPLLFLSRLGFDLGDGDAHSTGRRIEGEGIVAEGWRKVPGELLDVFRFCVVSEGTNDELAGKRELSELDPYLPIDARLAECVLLASDTVDGTRADVNRTLDLLDVHIVGAPFEEVEQRKLDSVLVVEIVGQFRERWRCRNGRVVVEDLPEDGEVLPVEKRNR